jgi:hypothetical protein
MNSKILLSLIFSMLLLSTASAMTVYGDFLGGGQSAVITQGSGVKFNVDFFSMSPPMTMSVGIYDSQGNLVQPFTTTINGNTNEKTYSNTYTYTPSASGTYTIEIIGTDSANTDSEFLTLTVNSQNPIDTTNPVITLLGLNPQTITKGNSYYEYGAIATDNVDGDITNKIIIDSGDVNTNIVGTYVVNYNVKDSSGNPAITKTRTVDVVLPNNGNTNPPVITIISPEENNQYDTCSLSIRISTDEQADVTFRLDEGVVTEMNNPSDNTFTYTLNDLSDTKHYLTFYATDDAGNQASESIGFYVKNCDENNNNNNNNNNNGGSSVGFIGNDFYDNNRYYDQFAGNVVNNGVATSTTGGAIYDVNSNTQNSDNTLLIIFLVTLIIAFSAVLIGLAIFIARKPRRVQGRQRQNSKFNETYY